jgi:hypothetical protein
MRISPIIPLIVLSACGAETSSHARGSDSAASRAPVSPANTAPRDFGAFKDLLKLDGFSEVLPASTLLPPGTIVIVREPSSGQVDVLCTAKAAFGDSLGVIWSATTTSKVARQIDGSFSLDAAYLKTISGSAGANIVRSISFALDSAQIGELPADQIFTHVGRRSAGCSTAMRDAYSNGERLSLITSVLKASTLYTVSLSSDAHLNAEAKERIMKGVAASLGLSGGRMEASTISGLALYWGVRDNARYATLMPGGRNLAGVRDTGTVSDTSAIRLIPAEVTVAVIRHP